MKLELHLLIGSQKGSKASSRGGKSEEACEIVSLVLQRHQDDLGEAEEISVEELLPEEEARKVGTMQKPFHMRRIGLLEREGSNETKCPYFSLFGTNRRSSKGHALLKPGERCAGIVRLLRARCLLSLSWPFAL